MTNEPTCILHALSNADVLLVEPGFLVERRTVLGVHGDETDVAISLNWRDGAGCEWEADFNEKALTDAGVTRNRITLKDSEDAVVCVRLYGLKPMKSIGVGQDWSCE